MSDLIWSPLLRAPRVFWWALLVAVLLAFPTAAPAALAAVIVGLIRCGEREQAPHTGLTAMASGLSLAHAGMLLALLGLAPGAGWDLHALMVGTGAIILGLLASADIRRDAGAVVLMPPALSPWSTRGRLLCALGLGLAGLYWLPQLWGSWQLGVEPALWTLVLAIAIAVHLTGEPLRCLAACGLGLIPLSFYGDNSAALGLAIASVGLLWLVSWPGRSPSLRLLLLMGPGCAGLIAVLALYGADVALLFGVGLACLPALCFIALPPSERDPAQSLPPSWRWMLWGKLRSDPCCRQLLSAERPWGRILDAGCGYGLGAVLAASRPGSQRYCGIDLDRGKLAVARALVAGLQLPCILGWGKLPGALPGPSGERATFDTILALDILHYWPQDKQGLLLAWLTAHLAEDGVIWLREALSDAEGAELIRRGEQWTTGIGLNPGGSLHFLDEDQLRLAFQQQGLQVQSCQPSGAANRLWELVRAP